MGNMTVSMDPICDDLLAEHAALDLIVSPLPDDAWDQATPAEGWSVSDQISHLAYFDGAGQQAVDEPEAFREGVRVLMEESDPGQAVLVSVEKGRGISPAQLLAWWREARTTMTATFRQLDAKDRVPWYGLDMGARSFATARLMETWAHGQDIVDTLGVEREATDRLRHIAHIANGARPYSYLVNGLELPATGVRVELVAPSGELWTWGDEDAADQISGDALDFCLLAIQRRHRDDVDLSITGAGAEQWSSIMQTFAGPAGGGRAPLS